MKKVISKKKGNCPVCGKKGTVKMYDNGTGFCEHNRIKTGMVIMGHPVTEVQGCHISGPTNCKCPNDYHHVFTDCRGY